MTKIMVSVRETIIAITTQNLKSNPKTPNQTVENGPCPEHLGGGGKLRVRANIHLGGQTEFCPNVEHKLFVTRPR